MAIEHQVVTDWKGTGKQEQQLEDTQGAQGALLNGKSPFLVAGTISQAVLPKEPTTWRREVRGPSKMTQQQGQKKPGNLQTVLKSSS